MKIFHLMTIALIFISLIACGLGSISFPVPVGQSGSNEQAILGKWCLNKITNLETSTSSAQLGADCRYWNLEFFRDSTVVVSGFETGLGSYSFSDNTHMKIVWAGKYVQYPPEFYEVLVSGDQLTLSEKTVSEKGLNYCLTFGVGLIKDGKIPSAGMACQFTRTK